VPGCGSAAGMTWLMLSRMPEMDASQVFLVVLLVLVCLTLVYLVSREPKDNLIADRLRRYGAGIEPEDDADGL